ncbi:MAG: cysteine-rich small domain-containing protein [Anaerovoracaceae bacterium]
MEMETKNYSFFQHKTCECFPCHQEVKEEDFNCLFCFCPLYSLGEECGGKFSYDNEKGVKDCSSCLIPHQRSAYDYMLEKCKIICERVRKK